MTTRRTPGPATRRGSAGELEIVRWASDLGVADELYMVEGRVPHAVGAITDHVLLAVGSPHRPVDAADRMTLVGYEAVTAAVDDLHCLICDLHARYPRRLHDAGCLHCPCFDCHPYPG